MGYFLLLFNLIIAQDSDLSVNFRTQPSDSSLWWIENNNYGKSYNNDELEIIWSLNNKKNFIILNISNTYDEKNKFNFGESYIKHTISDNTFLKFGLYYRDFSTYLNSDLSLGSILISNNAKPFPKIGIVSSKKINRFNFRFGMLHGKLKRNSIYTKAPSVHEKFLYMDIPMENNQSFSIGLVHEALWAGATNELGNFPNSFKDFLKVFISADGHDPTKPLSHANALGSHLGIWDFAYKYNLQSEKQFMFYYQHIFEDTSSLRFANKIDGLWGFQFYDSINNYKILLEYLNTTNSGIDPPYQADTYYWNYQYQDGWKFDGKVIGNPYINPESGPRGVYGHEQLKVLHFASDFNIKNEYNILLKASRRVHVNDSINYQISLLKRMNDKINISISGFNGMNDSAFIFGIDYLFK